MHQVLFIGQLYQDTILYMDAYPNEDSKVRARDMEQRRGGNIGNTAEVLAQMRQIQPWCMSALGSQQESIPLLALLTEAGIETKLCLYRTTPLPSSFIIQSAQGTRTIISCNKTKEIDVNEFIAQVEPVLQAERFAWIHFEGRNIDGVFKQIDWLRQQQQQDWKISIELEKPDRPDIDQLLPKGDVLFFSRLFAEARGYSQPEGFLRAMAPKCSPKAVLYCTWGEQGASCLSQHQLFQAPAPKVQAVDSVGAGDTFIAGVIYGWQQQWSLQKILENACLLATHKVVQVGFSGLSEKIK
ncbi:Ribokinase-like protein [Hesseltinella vesiculosa]|uniref:Ribokinase-like protein n=1 Tax=Hesseltinella vesiculosa TaxID=101127 RepID=A0A1X2G690_9FUNG|nr:Ribokinase-like protein [Hesseltinella vesiculosa]